MEIKSISNSSIRTDSSSSSKSSGKAKSSASDKIEISAEAKIKSVNPTESKDLELINQRINNKFYDTDEVIDKVANTIIKLLSKFNG